MLQCNVCHILMKPLSLSSFSLPFVQSAKSKFGDRKSVFLFAVSAREIEHFILRIQWQEWIKRELRLKSQWKEQSILPWNHAERLINSTIQLKVNSKDSFHTILLALWLTPQSQELWDCKKRSNRKGQEWDRRMELPFPNLVFAYSASETNPLGLLTENNKTETTFTGI